ncbi:MAG: (Fe-S)-binding protein [Dehalococcoidia bacterium]
MVQQLVQGRVVIPLNLVSGFRGADAPADADLTRCVHCGLCLNHCPTYVATGQELESPRGRIALIRAVHEGRAPLSQTLIHHLDLCLQCRACEAVCPSGVPYGRIIESAKAQIFTQKKEPRRKRIVRTAALRALLPHKRVMRSVAEAFRLYERCGLQGALRRSPIYRLLPDGLREMEQLTPRVSRRFFRPDAEFLPAFGAPRHRVALFTGCIMPYMNAETHAATVRVLRRNGCDVLIPKAQNCCGALLVHSGDREPARELARRNIDLLLGLDLDAVIINAAGCGSTLKEYGGLLKDDPQYAEKALHFDHLVKDVTEYVAALPFDNNLGELDVRVTYQDSCHLVHAQRIKDAPRALLHAIPGLQLVEMAHADMCCGSAGIYNIMQREMSMQVLDDKMREVAETGAEVISTANPGCMLQLETGLRRQSLPGRVVHVIELLDASYRVAERNDAVQA